MIERVVEAVAAVCNVPPFEILGRWRTPHVAHARQLAYLLARDLTGYSYPAIARAFQRDHTTVLHGCREANRRISESPEGRVLYRNAKALVERVA